MSIMHAYYMCNHPLRYGEELRTVPFVVNVGHIKLAIKVRFLWLGLKRTRQLPMSRRKQNATMDCVREILST